MTAAMNPHCAIAARRTAGELCTPPRKFAAGRKERERKRRRLKVARRNRGAEREQPDEGGPAVKDERELPSLTPNQLEALRRFAILDINEEELRRHLAGVFEVHFEPTRTHAEGRAPRRTVSGSFRMPEPGIVITRDHIANALERKRLGKITERDLVHWATILLLNDAYVLDPGDEDLIAEWLNDISLHLDAS